MARLALMAIVALLASCATTAGYERILNSWVGREEIDLVRSWGPPLQAYETAGRKFLSYSSEKMVYRAASPGRCSHDQNRQRCVLLQGARRRGPVPHPLLLPNRL